MEHDTILQSPTVYIQKLGVDNEADSIAGTRKFGIGDISRQKASLAEEAAPSKKLRNNGACGERRLGDGESDERGSGALSEKMLLQVDLDDHKRVRKK